MNRSKDEKELLDSVEQGKWKRSLITKRKQSVT